MMAKNLPYRWRERRARCRPGHSHRPDHPPHQLQLFWEVDQRYWHRHASKPGLTGLAQVRGFRGATLERADLVNRLQADLEYLNGWSLAQDIRILAATLRVMVHRNAF